MARALIDPSNDNRICQVVNTPAQEFPAAPPLEWVKAPATVDTTWTYNGQSFEPPAPQPPEPRRPVDANPKWRAIIEWIAELHGIPYDEAVAAVEDKIPQ